MDKVIAAEAEAMKEEEEEEDISGAVSLSYDEESLVEAGGILSWEECVRQGNWTGRPNSLNITKTYVPPPYLPAPVPSTLPIASACAAIFANQYASLSPTNLSPNMKSDVTLRYPTIYNMAAAFLCHAQTLAQSQHSPVSASKAAVSAAAGATSCKVAILDSGATHYLWPSYKAFISYNRVYNQYATLADNRKFCIAGKVAIAIEMGRKKMIIHDVYHVQDLCLPLFGLRVHRRIPGCGYHSNKDGIF